MKVYSLDEETYYDKEDFKAMIEDFQEENIIRTWYEGIKEKIHHKEFISAYSIVEEMQNQAYAQSELADDYLCDVLKDELKLNKLESILSDFFEENAGKVPFFNVLNKIQRRNTDKEILELLNSKPEMEVIKNKSMYVKLSADKRRVSKKTNG